VRYRNRSTLLLGSIPSKLPNCTHLSHTCTHLSCTCTHLSRTYHTPHHTPACISRTHHAPARTCTHIIHLHSSNTHLHAFIVYLHASITHLQYFSVPHPFRSDSGGLQWTPLDFSQKCKQSPLESTGVQVESSPVQSWVRERDLKSSPVQLIVQSSPVQSSHGSEKET